MLNEVHVACLAATSLRDSLHVAMLPNALHDAFTAQDDDAFNEMGAAFKVNGDFKDALSSAFR